MTLQPRVVLVERRTELDELVARHGTRGQAEFFLRTRERSIDEVEQRHRAATAALEAVSAAIPTEWRRGRVERADLDRFSFDPDDVVVVVGQDGLVANVAKYLDGQVVVGIDPEPGRNPGVLVRHRPDEAGALLRAAAAGAPEGLQQRTMVAATIDDGQQLVALNELFIGHASHQSARYSLRCGAGSEQQSSSGVLVGTGTGASGWLRSVRQQRAAGPALPGPEDPLLCWFVREAWPSPASGTELVEGRLAPGECLSLVARADDLVVFGDGMEGDAIHLHWGQEVTMGLAERRLRLL